MQNESGSKNNGRESTEPHQIQSTRLVWGDDTKEFEIKRHGSGTTIRLASSAMIAESFREPPSST